MKSKKLFEFECAQHGSYEDWAYDNEQRKPCPKCGTMNDSIIVPVRSQLDGSDPDFPTAAERWAKDHEKGARKG